MMRIFERNGPAAIDGASVMRSVPRPNDVGANGFDRMLVRTGGAPGTQAVPVNTCLDTTVANGNYALAA